MMKITLQNKTHGTKVNVVVFDRQIKTQGPLDTHGDIVLTTAQTKTVSATLCGDTRCDCSLIDSDEYTLREERLHVNPHRRYFVLERKVRK
jgi:hypothetical protein